MVQESIQEGIYPPHRSSPMCSRRYYGYWRECEREFGERVAEWRHARSRQGREKPVIHPN